MGSKKYNTSVDIWSVGCIFAELVNRKPLFCGQTEEDQLDKIFKIRGTPSEEEWPQIKELPLYKPEVVQASPYPTQDIRDFVPNLDEDGIDLLLKLLQCDPSKRITAAEAMKHPYLHGIQ